LKYRHSLTGMDPSSGGSACGDGGLEHEQR
jgi:hypothetical protein